MDFFQIATKEARGGVTEVYPDFIVGRHKDIMVRGQSFYAIWDEEKGLWSTDEYDVQRIVDSAVTEHADKLMKDGVACNVKLLKSFNTNGWKQFRTFLKNVSDNSHELDSKITFKNTEVKKSDYVSRRLPYDLVEGPHPAYDELTHTLYSEEERAKFEWAIGAIISGDSKKIEKFFVFYGPGGTGKSTVMNIIKKMFEGYVAMFEAKALVGNNNNFATDVFRKNPLVAIQQDGDLSRIEDNSKLNSIVSHDDMSLNEKYKSSYDARINALLLMGTNKPVKITDAKSGLIRRLIDIHPTGDLVEVSRYNALMQQVDFELGAIAQHCLNRYREMGRNYYNGYRPVKMMFETDIFFNFVDAYYDILKSDEGITLKRAYSMYVEYCKESSMERKLPQYKFREELKNYFDEFHDRLMVDGETHHSYFKGFNAAKFKVSLNHGSNKVALVLDETESLLDELLKDMPAQRAKEDETPQQRWSQVKTTLSDIDTSEVHYVKVPQNHIIIDFDLKDGKDGKKSLQLNLEAASAWPATYAELSKSGRGVHLHYDYEGDASDLASVYSDGIEIKVYTGDASLRRKLTKCNGWPVSKISSGLPYKEKKTVLDEQTLKSEKGLRELIHRNLRKEIHPGTKPSIDFIYKILDDAYKSGMVYDVSDLRPRIMAFANNSSNQAMVCLKIFQKMKFKSEETAGNPEVFTKDEAPIVFFDIECYPNLFTICWMYDEDDAQVIRLINPKPNDLETLLKCRLVGFNNRKYDNHMLWACYMGYNNQQLYELSQKIIDNNQGAMFGEAYNLSYADIYDFSTVKQSLKKFMIQYGMHHMEMDIPWDEPVPEEKWKDVEEYNVNDVLGTRRTFHERKGDFQARQILAELSGLSVNDTTQKHTARIIFGNDRNPQDKFIYTDLSQEFPGYTYDFGKSTYRDELVGEGGYVYAEPGIYENVVLLDVASMHPTSIGVLQAFGEYTPRFLELLEARLAIKHASADLKESKVEEAEVHLNEARKMLGGKLAKYLVPDGLKALSDALKIAINIVYGLTSAKFDNPFRDKRNVDNIVAKRGALFMIDLKHFVQSKGFTVAHIKTDSIKIPDATPEIIAEVMEFGQRYGYSFEHEATYEKFCLVNDAVYVARNEGKWTATGAQFQHPVIFKALFSDEAINFDDLCETKQVTNPGVLYLDFNEAEATPNTPYAGMHHVGKIGRFVPVHASAGGAKLIQMRNEKPYAISGTKGYLWLEAEMVNALHADFDLTNWTFDELVEWAGQGAEGFINDVIDLRYYENLVNDAIETIEKFGDFQEFLK